MNFNIFGNAFVSLYHLGMLNSWYIVMVSIKLLYISAVVICVDFIGQLQLPITKHKYVLVFLLVCLYCKLYVDTSASGDG